MSNIKPHLALLCVAFLYGANYSIAKTVMQDGLIHPFTFIFIRVISGMLFFLGFHWFFIKEKVDKKDFPLLILCGLTGVAINQMFFFSGLKETTPIHASLIMITTPLIVMTISAFVFKNKLTTYNILGIILGAIGAVYLITDGQNVEMSASYIKGDFMIFVNASSYALYLVLVRKLLLKYNPFTVTKWIFLIGAIAIIPISGPYVAAWDYSVLNTNHVMAILYVIIGTTILAYLFNAYALSKLKPTIVGSYIYLQPLIAGFISIQLGQDEMSVTKSIAAVMIFAGVIIASRSKKTLNPT